MSLSHNEQTTLESVDGKVTALQNDVKEIYYMLAKAQNGSKQFSKLSIEQKILTVYKELHVTAKQAGVTLSKEITA